MSTALVLIFIVHYTVVSTETSYIIQNIISDALIVGYVIELL